MRVFLFLVFTRTVRVPWGGSHGVHERICFFFCSHVFGFFITTICEPWQRTLFTLVVGEGLRRYYILVCIPLFGYFLPGFSFLGDPGMSQWPLAGGGRESITCPASLRFLVFCSLPDQHANLSVLADQTATHRDDPRYSLPQPTHLHPHDHRNAFSSEEIYSGEKLPKRARDGRVHLRQ